jgi:diacylglycerol kinase family enzyme
MRRATLLFNPLSGRANPETIERISSVLRNRGIDVTRLPTQGPGSAGQQSAAASTDILFACGGDGTIHEVLQGLVFHPRTALGVIPMGTANALARHLQLSLDPVQAALQQLARIPQTVPVGHIVYSTPTGPATRYFLIMAGAGPDAALVYRSLASAKSRFGRAAYYLRSAALFASTRFSAFPVTTSLGTQLAVSAMAVRISDLGGLFSPLTQPASLDHPHLTLNLVRPPGTIALPAWFALSWARLHRINPYTQTISTDTFTCGPGLTSPIRVQADGESLGHTPVTVTLIPKALRILLPSSVS